MNMPKGIVTYVSEDLYEKFKRLCALEGSTIKDKVNELIEAWVESNETPKQPEKVADQESSKEDISKKDKEKVAEKSNILATLFGVQ